MSEWKDYYRLSARDLSKSSISRLRVTAGIGLATMVFGLIITWGGVPANGFTVFLLLAGVVTGFVALLHRLPNFLSFTDKHLDEWERIAKKNAESFTYRVTLCLALALTLLGMAITSSDVSGLQIVLKPSLEQVGFTLILIPFLLQFTTTNHLAWSVKPLSNEDVNEMVEVEAPRKLSKWSFLICMGLVVVMKLGGNYFDKHYGDIANATSETCVVMLKADTPLAQVKNLEHCETVEPKTE